MKAETSIFSFLYLSRMVKYAKHEHFFWNIGFDPFLGTTTPPSGGRAATLGHDSLHRAARGRGAALSAPRAGGAYEGEAGAAPVTHRVFCADPF